jgi:hypothetical protein
MCRMQPCLRIVCGALSFTLLNGLLAQALQPASSPWNASGGPGLAALAEAAEQGRFAYVLFWRHDDDATHQMRRVLTQAVPTLGTPVSTILVRVDDAREAEAVKVFGVDRAPLPLLAAVAPNGAVTKAWPLKAAAEQLREGLVSTGTAALLKSMQDQKLSLVCVRNSQLLHAAEAQQAVVGFQADARFGAATNVIEIDPRNAREQALLTSLQVSPQTSEAVTVLLSPAGQAVGKFTGAVTTAEITAKVLSAQQGCCPGGQCGPDGQCGPGGCCPGGQCGPQK